MEHLIPVVVACANVAREMFAAILAKHVVRGLANVELLPRVLVRHLDRTVTRQITSVNVHQLFLLVVEHPTLVMVEYVSAALVGHAPIQVKLAILDLANVEVLQLVLDRHLVPIAMLQIIYANVRLLLLLAVEPPILVMAVNVSAVQVARVAIQGNPVLRGPACVGLLPLVSANQLAHIATLVIMCANVHLL